MNSRRVLLIAFAALLAAIALHVIQREVRLSRKIDGRVIAKASEVSATERSLRPSYPYSVIPGGAYSPAELRYASEHDGLVREHYRGFDMRSAWLVKLTDERYQYVSFRLNNRVFWTSKKLRIPKGEVLLTDGRNYARTRCGNRLSSTRQLDVTKEQPTRALSLPPFRPEMLSPGPLQVAPAPPVGELAQEFPLLPFDMPTLAPYVPPAMETPPLLASNWPIEGYWPPIVPVMGGGSVRRGVSLESPSSPGAPGSSGLPGLPSIPAVSLETPPVIAAVPEPASLSVVVILLSIVLWLLARMARQERGADESSMEMQSEK